jgi:hypothetical protein
MKMIDCNYDDKEGYEFVQNLRELEALHSVNGTRLKQFCIPINKEVWRHRQTGLFKVYEDADAGRRCIFYCTDSHSPLDTLHRTDGPAKVIIYKKNGRLSPSSVEWFAHGVQHRDEDEGPQEIFYEQDAITRICFRKNGKVHRDRDKPSVVSYFPAGQLYIEEWFKDGFFDRDGNPSCIFYFADGNVWHETWHRKGLIHRLDGSAMTVYLHSGAIKDELWMINGRALDRRKLPAFKNGHLVGRVKLTKSSILKACLFDREYGAFLQQKLKEREERDACR